MSCYNLLNYFFQNVQNVENISETHLKTSPEGPPRLVVYLDTDDNVPCIYVVGVGDGTTILDRLIDFRCCYFAKGRILYI